MICKDGELYAQLEIRQAQDSATTPPPSPPKEDN